MRVVLTGVGGQLGREFARVLQSSGAYVIGIDCNEDECKQIEHLDEFHNVDITDQETVEEFFSKTFDIDCLINNAGIGVFTPTLKRTKEEFFSVMSVNLWGTFSMSNEYIKSSKMGGKIINIASMYGHVSSDFRIYGDSGRNNSEVYTATKAGVIAITKYIAVHHADKNIICNSISPGGVRRNQSSEFIKNYCIRNPQKRLAESEEIASVVKFLVFDAPKHLTGEDIKIDGGFTAW